MPKQVAIYTRVSTDHQTTENQERELQAIADRMGWAVVKIYRDQGISGAKSRKDRPAFDALWKDAARRRFDMIMAWSVDRLGRSLRDLITMLDDLRARGVKFHSLTEAIDTATPTGRAMCQMIGVLAKTTQPYQRTHPRRCEGRAAPRRWPRHSSLPRPPLRAPNRLSGRCPGWG